MFMKAQEMRALNRDPVIRARIIIERSAQNAIIANSACTSVPVEIQLDPREMYRLFHSLYDDGYAVECKGRSSLPRGNQFVTVVVSW